MNKPLKLTLICIIFLFIILAVFFALPILKGLLLSKGMIALKGTIETKDGCPDSFILEGYELKEKEPFLENYNATDLLGKRVSIRGHSEMIGCPAVVGTCCQSKVFIIKQIKEISH